MVLKAADELRHPLTDDYFQRESVYFNFADPTNEMGAWLYLWVTPNQEKKAGIIVCFYHGITERLDSIRAAMESPRHLYEEEGGNWLYCYFRQFDESVDADFGDIELGGLALKRIEPMKQYRVSFADDEGSSGAFDVRMMTIPWDYSDGVYKTPEWMAANRYHRSHWMKGSMELAGRSYEIDTTGDSDHSWGTRNHEVFSLHNNQMFSFQTRDGRMSVSAVKLGKLGEEALMGFIDLDGDIQAIADIQETAEYTDKGVHSGVHLVLADAKGRQVEAHQEKMFASIGLGNPEGGAWGYEGVGHWDVEGFSRLTGISSTFWPADTTPKILQDRYAAVGGGS